jgi:putative FmdB family regulatory protein
LPLYPYRCTQCGHRFEKIQRFSEEPVKVCPQCGGAVERVLTAPGLQFKGAGWYVNDYAPKSASPGGDGAAGEKKPETKPGTKSEAKTETKAASGGESSTSGSSGSSSSSSTPPANSSSTTS